MLSTMVNIYQVRVFFNGKNKQFVFAGDMKYGGEGRPFLKISPGIHAIVFTLATVPDLENPAEASFSDNPIVGYVSDILLSSTVAKSRCTLVVSNLGVHVGTHGFTVNVIYDGQCIQSDDPTIITDPPVEEGG